MAGQIWEALNGTEGLTQKQIKKATKLKADKDFFLGLGWLLREKCVGTSFGMLSTHFFCIIVII